MVDFPKTAEVVVPPIEPTQETIHLFVDAKDGVSDAVVAVRWCICHPIFDRIKDEKFENPHLLLVLIQEEREVRRQLIPLSREMTFISFPRPGNYRIKATILAYPDAGHLRRQILGKGPSGAYQRSVVDFEGNIYGRDMYPGMFQIGNGEIGVNVAPEFFAKKPAQWLWNWGNLWYETEPRDQCQFRRRCILAFSIQPIAVFIWYLIVFLFRLFTAVLLRYGCGKRGIDFSPVIHIFRDSTEDIWDDSGTSVFRQYPRFLRQFFLIIIDKAFPLFSERRFQKEKRKLDRRIAKIYRRNREKEINFKRECDEFIWPLVCKQDGAPLEPSIKAISKQRRTIYLRYLDLKARVCKPFAK